SPAPVALVGELLATQAAVHGAVAILVDAAVRDLVELRELGLPIWTRWVRVAGATKDHRGQLDVPVQVGGARIAPGAVVVLDADGGVVGGRDQGDQFLAAARARQEKEAGLRPRLLAGELSYDLHGLRARDVAEDAATATPTAPGESGPGPGPAGR